MKIQLLYGAAITLAALVVSAALSLGGFYSDASKLHSANLIGGFANFVLGVTIMVLGVVACRNASPASAPFDYGRAFGAAFFIGLYSCVFGLVATLLVFKVIAPGLHDLVMQSSIDKAVARGADPEKAENIARISTSLPVVMIAGFIGGLVVDTLVALVVAIFLRREAIETPAPTPV